MKLFRDIISIVVVLMIGTFSIRAEEPQPFSRGLQQSTFIPKGQWITGVNVNYSQSSQDDYQFFIIEDISGDSYSFKVSPMVMYSFKDNIAAGGRLAYSRSMTKLETGQVKLDSETTYDVENFYCLSHNYSAMAAFRNYISIGNSKRFGFFNEVQLQVGGGESKLCDGSGNDLTGTFERSYGIDLGVAPGIVMFLNNYSALEVNVGVLGFSYSHTKATTDRVYVSRRDNHSANLQLNLFSISFGVAFYL